MNTVNPDNFNVTMQGYVEYALNFAIERNEFTDKQIDLIRNGFRWGKSEMTLEDARNYYLKKYK